IKVYFVSSYGEKETVAENVDEILWAGFNAAEDCFTVYYRVGKNYHRRKISVYSQGEDGLTVKSLAELKPRMVRASHISHVTQNILTELSKQALAAYKNKKAGGVTGQEWTGILNLGQLVILGSDIRGLDVASDGNMYIPTGKKGTVGVISSNGDFFDLAIGDQSKSAQITKKSCSTDKYVVSNTDKGIGIQSGENFKKWIPAVFEDIIVRETPEGCEIFGLNVGRISRILYYETTNLYKVLPPCKLKEPLSLFTFKKIFWNKDRTKILATDGAKNLCLLSFDVSDPEDHRLDIEAYSFPVPIGNVVDIIEDENGNILVLGNKIEVDDKGVTISESSELQ
ncbi:MAG: hypothetical protein KAJ14_03410, partial [Candidatus Omnitrophica bacterium]|nr:hypothetical protein [Candidatus Omnitrophota bacterium]